MEESGLNIIEVDDEDIERLVKEEAAARDNDSPTPNPSNSPQRTSLIPGSHGGAAIEKSNLMKKVVMDFLLTTGGIKKKKQVTVLLFKGTSQSTRPPIAKTSKVTTSPTARTTPRVTAPIRTPKVLAPTTGTVQPTPPFIQTPQVTNVSSMLTSHSIMPLIQVCKLTTPIAKTSQVITTAEAAAPPQVPTLMRTPHMTVLRTGQLVKLTTPFMSTPPVATPVTIRAQHTVQGTNPIVTAQRVMISTVATPQLTIPVIAKPRGKTTTQVTATPVKEYRLRKPVARKSPETGVVKYVKIRPSMNQTEGPCWRPVQVTGPSGHLTPVVLKEGKRRAPPSVPLKAPVSDAGNGTALTGRTLGLVLDAGKVTTPSIASFVTKNLPQVRVELDKVTTLIKHVPGSTFKAVGVTRLAGPRKTGTIPEFLATVNPRQPAARPFQCPHCVKDFTTELRLRGHLRDHQDVNADSAQNKVRALPAEIHQCPHCVKRYSSELKLQAHIRIHKGTLKIHQCTFCPARFAQSSDLRVHVRKHTKERPYRCSECNLGFSRLAYLNKHLEKHTKDMTFTCSLCAKSFPTTKGLKNHEKEHTELCRHQCPECGKPYKTQFAMKYHLLTHSKVKLPKCPVCYRLFSEESKLAAHMLVHVGENELTCPVCDKKFTKSYQKRIHMRIHGVKKCREKGLKSDSVLYENSEASPQRERQEEVRKHMWQHKCLTCGKSFQTERKLDWHTLIHSTEKSFQCSVCSKAFSRKCSLKEGEKPFCPDCDESLLGLRQMRTLKVISERPRSSHCTDCGGWFLSKKVVETHRRTMETPLSCVICNREFSSSCAMRVHRQSHMVELRNRRWDCSVCGVACRNRSHLKKHKVKHSSEKPYRCPVCDKGFARNSDMQKHKFIHSSEKPYHCFVCRKGFNSSSNFRLHERRHKGEKPYRCPHCIDGFYVKQGLTRHMEKHHPDQDPGKTLAVSAPTDAEPRKSGIKIDF